MQNINIHEIYSDRVSTNNNDIRISSDNLEKAKSEPKVSENIKLRDIKISEPFYNQKDVKTTIKDIEAKINSNQTELQRKNNLTLAMAGMTSQDFSKMKEDGFSPEETDDEAYVTIADKIRVQLAKGGADISMMGDVSDAALDAISGSASGRQSIENALAKASEVGEINDDIKSYLIKNDAEPTIENVHKAAFSVSKKYEYNPEDAGLNQLSKSEVDELLPQIEGIIKKAGYPVNEDTVGGAKWLIEHKLPLTEDSINSFIQLETGEKKVSEQELLVSISDAIREGKSPEEGYILSGFSAREQSVDSVSLIQGITDIQIENAVRNSDPMTLASISSQSKELVNNNEISDTEKYELVSNRRYMEELRLSMTLEASFSMSMRGINIDTTSLSALVDELKAEETRLYSSLFGDSVEGASNEISFEEKINIYKETNDSINELKQAPISSLASFHNVSDITLRSLSVEAKVQTAKYKAAGDTYEALMTAPRKDMGDSIKKAFRNVDEILKDLGLEASESNQRAVRIHGYNSLEITKESVLNIRSVDENLQKTFKNLVPGVVAKMVKEGINPLNLSLEELNKKIDDVRSSDSSFDSSESFAEFLYKMDRQDGLSKEERASFVGIYRLIHQVTESDGAVIGALLNQGADVTMRNMMMAIRSDKHKNRESVIDDSFGELKSFNPTSLSITDQIEMAFQTNRMEDAKDAISPSKLASFETEDEYMNMSPDQFAFALENMEEDVDDERSYVDSLKHDIGQVIQSETKVYEALRQFDLPTSPANLRAMDAFLADRNNVFRKVFSNTVTSEDLEKTPQDIMNDIIKRFGEAVKTLEDMAKAQEKLAETAENVMKNMEVEVEVDHLDIRGMRVSLRQIQMLGEIAGKRENYTIPITVADENGTLNLKIVRGTDDKNGLVDIAFNMDKTGPVSAVFKASAQGISGSISAVKQGILELLKEKQEELSTKLSNVSGENVNIGFDQVNTLNDSDLYGEKEVDFDVTSEKSAISTEKLYSMAKSFIDILGEI